MKEGAPAPATGRWVQAAHTAFAKHVTPAVSFLMNSSAAQSIPSIITHIVYHSKRIPFEIKSLIVTYFFVTGLWKFLKGL